MTLPKQLTTITPAPPAGRKVSKILAAVLFVMLPIFSFFLGMKYQEYLQPKELIWDGILEIQQDRIVICAVPNDCIKINKDHILLSQYLGFLNGKNVIATVRKVGGEIYLLGISEAEETTVLNPTPTPDVTAGWKTYRNQELQYEFKYPPDPLEPMRAMGDTSFVIGYFIDGGNPQSVQDVQNPDKTYWITLGYISQSQLNVMGITYCAAYPEDTSRCESFTVGGQPASIDWNIPVAIVWITHPEGGVVTFELQPVVSKSKEILYAILSTFRFVDSGSNVQKPKTSSEVETFCNKNGGTFLHELNQTNKYMECEYISEQNCVSAGGVFNDCASQCRHESVDVFCAQVCVPVCSF